MKNLEGKTIKEIRNELRHTANKSLIKFYIENEFSVNEEFVLNIEEMVDSIRSPSELDKILQELGWVRKDFDENGWQQDTWYWYYNPEYNFGLTMSYSGFYGNLSLYCSEF